ncbi:transmembrane and coiled-coil domain-containing protein 6 [Dryobates pubescens]|uniref:transmembrane and coiled-coil domain-containing protein 6 n=1 Tax=Dryobates pubescens TaxID=118200 RepID=UPI0023B8E50B|nr:transmembrane and coiled-coil domain-containing protein 6 [Dryobates pubescens]
MWGGRRQRPGPSGVEELRARRREREAALRRARRQEQLLSKRLLREDSAAEHGEGEAEPAPDPLSEDEALELLRGLQRGSEDRRSCLGRLRRALRHRESQQRFVRLDGSIRTLVGLFTGSLGELQLGAARCLHELSCGDPPVAEACLPFTPYLLTYLAGHSLELTELCLYTLGNLVVESQAVRRQLLLQGIIPVLASCSQSPHEAVLEGVGYVLSQLLQAKEAPMEIIPLVLSSALPQQMLRRLQGGLGAGAGAAVEFAWCLHYITCSHTANRELLALGALPALTELLLHLATDIPPEAPEGLELLVSPVLRSLSSLLAEPAGAEGQLQDHRLLVALFLLLQSFHQQQPFVVQEGLWLLNNLTAEEPFFCSALLCLDLLPALLQLLPCSQMASLLVLTVLCNVAGQGPAYCQQLHQQQALPLLLPTLLLPDPSLVGQCLELLHLLFLHWPEAAEDFVRQGGHQALERHQSSPELQERAGALLGMLGTPLAACSP